MRPIVATMVVGCLIPLFLTPAIAAQAEQQPPVERVLSKVDTLTITLTLRPDEGEERNESIKLRSVLLHVPGLLIEPHGQWPDGTPISANARISEDQAREIVRMLGERGFFNRAGAFHSERREPPQTPPPDSTRSYTEHHRPPDHPHLQIRLVTHDDDWYTYYIDHIRWGPRVTMWLEAIHAQLDGEPAEMLGRITAQLEPLREAEADDRHEVSILEFLDLQDIEKIHVRHAPSGDYDAPDVQRIASDDPVLLRELTRLLQGMSARGDMSRHLPRDIERWELEIVDHRGQSGRLEFYAPGMVRRPAGLFHELNKPDARARERRLAQLVMGLIEERKLE